MKSFAFIIAFTVSLVYGWSDVIRFNVDDNERSVLDFHKAKVDKLRSNVNHKQPEVGSWSYTNCGDPSTDLLVLTNLTLGPDPLSFPGELDVNFNALIRETVDAPLAANVTIEKKVGSEWIKIPCIDDVGSCKYDDLCDLLAGATCPDPFVAAKVPCKCPFNKGSYKLPKAKFDILAAVLPSGDYHARADLTYNNKHVACISINVTVV